MFPLRRAVVFTFAFAFCILAGSLVLVARDDPPRQTEPVRDPAVEATTAKKVPAERPEQKQSDHDKSDRFDWKKPAPLTAALKGQPNEGRILGFEFSRDPLGADKPFTTLAEVMKKEKEAKPKVMADQRKLLEARFNLKPNRDPKVTMVRGKPLCVGPTAKLPDGVTFDQLAKMSPDEIKKKGAFPYPSLPHPLHANGGQVFPTMQIAMFPRLERFDVDFDIPEEFLPEFPPAIFLQNRPELGDVSRGRSST